MQITEDFSIVKKALLSVSGCLQDNPKVDVANSGATKILGGSSHGTGIPAQVDPIAHWGFGPGFNASDYHSRNYSSNPEPENIGSDNIMAMLCHVDKVGSLIEKGGSSEYNTGEYMHVDLDALLDMSTNEIVKLFPAKAHKRIKIIIVDQCWQHYIQTP